MPDSICKPEIINRDSADLCPWFAQRSAEAIQICNDKGYPVRMFEGYRPPQRQDWIWQQGRTRPGKVVTRAKAWQSWHQFAVAQDLAFWDGRKWYWPDATDSLWDRVSSIMEAHGFEPLHFERPHFEITSGLQISEAYIIAQKSGMQAVWDLIKLRGKF